MAEFNKLIEKYSKEYGIIFEQGPAPTNPDEESPNEAQQPVMDPNSTELDPSVEQPTDSALPSLDQAQQTQQSQQLIVNEKELLLIRLIYKALTIDLDPSQYSDLLEITDINQNNANQVLDQLQQIINNY